MEFNLSDKIEECSRCKEYPQITEHIKQFIKLLKTWTNRWCDSGNEMEMMDSGIDKLAGDKLI